MEVSEGFFDRGLFGKGDFVDLALGWYKCGKGPNHGIVFGSIAIIAQGR